MGEDAAHAATGTRTSARRTPVRRWLRPALRIAVLVVLTVGLYGLLPRLGGFAEQAAVLREANPWLAALAALAQAGAVLLYVVSFQRVLAELGAVRRFVTVLDAWMAAFFVSHVAVGGTAAGFVVNVEALRDADVDRETTSEAIGLLSLFMASGIMAVLGLGLVLSAGSGLPATALPAVVLAVLLLAAAYAVLLSAARHPAGAQRVAERVGGRPLARRLRVDGVRLGASVRRLAARAQTLLDRRRLPRTVLPVAAEIVLDVSSLALFLTALGHPPPPGPLLVAYATATVVGLLPITPSGLGLVEGVLIGFVIGFGTPAAAAIPAVLGYRLVNFWLPIPVGAVSYARLTLARRRGAQAGR